MKNGIKNIITFIIAAAMLSAGVYAESAEIKLYEVTTASPRTEIAEEEPVPPDMPVEPYEPVLPSYPAEDDIAYDEPAGDGNYLPGENDIAVEVFPPEDVLPDEEFPSEDPWPEFADIDKYFATNGYPDYISYICNTGAAINGYDPSSGEEYKPQMTYWWDVGVVNATSEQKTEIETLINELYPIENIITFEDCTYSYNQRTALIPEIRETVEMLFPTIKVIDVTLIRNTEQIALQLDFSADGDVPEPDMVREKMYAIFGDLLFMGDFGVTTDDYYDGALPEAPAAMGAGGMEIGVDEEYEEVADEDGIVAIGGNVDSAPSIDEMAAIAAPEQSNNVILWICIAVALIIALGTLAFIYRAKLIPVFATSNGDVTAAKASKKQAEEAVKNSEITPDDSVLQAIKEKLEK